LKERKDLGFLFIYPKTTSRDTNAAAFISEVGLSPLLVSEVVLVFRTFPIRVAGTQAGPLKDEFTWEQLQVDSNSPIALHEYTSVTQKLRRLGKFDWAAAHRAITVNRPTRLAVNFTDYLGYENRAASRWDELNSRAREFIQQLENFHAPVSYVGTGSKLSQNIFRDTERGWTRVRSTLQSTPTEVSPTFAVEPV
jgi:adenylosuccinate synthase